ncbi:hypothetical protein QOT17_014978 [Balamuthia mandrillaris]
MDHQRSKEHQARLEEEAWNDFKFKLTLYGGAIVLLLVSPFVVQAVPNVQKKLSGVIYKTHIHLILIPLINM